MSRLPPFSSPHTSRLSRVLSAACFGLAGLVLPACDEGEAGASLEAPVPGLDDATVAAASGEGQHGRTGRPLPEPLTVEVRAPEGPVEGAAVAWEIVDGGGYLSHTRGRTDARGRARVTLVAGPRLETIRVRAHLVGDPTRFAELPSQVTAYLVVMKADRYRNLTYTDELRVSVGDTIEWVNKDMQDTGIREHSATAYRIPPGGRSFDSGMLEFDDRFRWVLDTPGTWEYHCKDHPQTESMRGTIRVSEPG